MNKQGFSPPLWTYRLTYTRKKLNILGMVRWIIWHRPPDAGLEIRVLAVRGRARYLLVTHAPHTTESLGVSGEEAFVSLKLECQREGRTCDPRLQGRQLYPLPRASSCWPPGAILANILEQNVIECLQPGTVFRRQNQTCTYVGFWRLMSIPSL